MSNRYKGGVISATPPTTTGGESGTASGAWTLEQQMQLTAAGLWPIQPIPNYIEQVFSTYLYTGNSTSQTITNGINLSGNGGLVWFKNRTAGSTGQMFYDTVRGAYKYLQANSSGAESNGSPDGLSAFTTSGFSVNGSSDYWNISGNNYASWTFREQAKFFDIVTYTGTGSAQNIAHSLGSTPGFIIVKSTSNVGGWYCYHRSLGATQYIVLNSANSLGAAVGVWNNTAPTSSVFTVGSFSEVNGSGQTFVAYVYAHDAGGFGVSGTDNVISCGAYTGSSSNVAINLGYEAQWVLVKNIGRDATNWQMLDIMRGMPLAGSAKTLAPNLSNAESSPTAPVIVPTATGMTITGGLGFSINYDGDSYIYIAIRRGPMAIPTVGTSVFAPSTAIEPQTTPLFTAGFSDMTLHKPRLSDAAPNFLTDRLRGDGRALQTNVNSASTFYSTYFKYDSNAGAYIPPEGYYNNSGGGTDPYALYAFRRAPQFFDEVALNSSTTTYTHNLTVSPELIFVKCTDVGGANWVVYNKSLSTPTEQYLRLNTTDGVATNGPGTWAVSSTQFSVDPGLWANGAAGVSYLFATCAGVSKVGSYTGTGALLTVDCAFTTGARFVFIKRTDSTGDWYVWDSARGITGGNDPYWLLNNAAVQVTGTNYVDTTGVGFQVTAAAPAGINASGGTYIFLAIA